MPDHVHLLVRGLVEHSDGKVLIKLAKQYSGYYFTKTSGQQLWQRYGFERVIRDDVEFAFVIGYIIGNPVRAGLVALPCEYPYTGSERYTMTEMLEISEYASRS
jgi:REP element-mobilizing transposase RayT